MITYWGAVIHDVLWRKVTEAAGFYMSGVAWQLDFHTSLHSAPSTGISGVGSIVSALCSSISKYNAVNTEVVTTLVFSLVAWAAHPQAGKLHICPFQLILQTSFLSLSRCIVQLQPKERPNPHKWQTRVSLKLLVTTLLCKNCPTVATVCL